MYEVQRRGKGEEMTYVDKELRRFMNGLDESVRILGGVPLCMFLQRAQEYIEDLRTQYDSVDVSLRNGVKK